MTKKNCATRTSQNTEDLPGSGGSGRVAEYCNATLESRMLTCGTLGEDN